MHLSPLTTCSLLTGGSWKEDWSERCFYMPGSLEMTVERQAHKWAADGTGDEWEEKWGEYYTSEGKVAKWADKWGKAGPNVWHEKWGEDYQGGCCCWGWGCWCDLGCCLFCWGMLGWVGCVSGVRGHATDP
jgi:hypothetical protein